MFQRYSSETGAVLVRWPRGAWRRDADGAGLETAGPALLNLSGDVHLWVLLADPERFDPSGFTPEGLLREIIRVPVPVGSEEVTAYVPTGRVLGLALVGRDAAGLPLVAPAFQALDVRMAPAPFERPPSEHRAPEAPPAAPIAPVAQVVIEPRAGRTPLVFAHTAAGAAPNAPSAPSAPGTPSAGPLHPIAEALHTLAARVAEHARVPVAKAPGPTGFGARQRFYLTRMSFPSGYAGPRVVVIRRTFIAEHDLETWAAGPPPDAHALPATADGFVDALTPDDEMAFYAVMQGPAPWRSLPLSPVQPPFDSCRQPFFVGDGRKRIGPWLRGSPPSGPQRELLEAALRGAPW